MGKFKEKLSVMTREELEAYATELMSDKFEAENLLEEVFETVKKQKMATNELIQDYDMGDNIPDVEYALEWFKHGNISQLAIQSAKWIYEYNRIMWLINIANDYGSKLIKLKNSYEAEDCK